MVFTTLLRACRGLIGAGRGAAVARLAAALALGALGALSTACTDDDAQPRQPLPLAEGQPTAYTESYLAQHPWQVVRPGHTVVMRLEAVADGEDDTGSEPGVDEVPYYVETPTTVTLHADAATQRLGQIVLRDESGRELGRHRGSDASAVVTLTLQPGIHRLELYHAAKGDPTASPQWLFVRLGAAGQTVVQAHVAAGGTNTTGLLGAAATELVTTASSTCHGCVYSNSTFQAGSVMDGIDMSGSTFTNMTMTSMSIYNSLCTSCVFSTSNLVSSDFTTSDFSQSNFLSSDLSGLNMAYNFTTGVASVCHNCSFGEQINNVHFWGADFAGSSFLILQDLYVIDLSGNNCAGCWLRGPVTGPLSVITILHLEGTNLTGGQITNLSATNAHFEGATLATAQFLFFNCTTCTMTDVKGAGMWLSGTFAAVDLSRADLTGATVYPYAPNTWVVQSGSFANAKFDSFTPSNFFGSAVFTNATQGQVIDFTGTSFANLDLSHANFSSSAAKISTATSFAGARLSDGSTGIDLSGQDLSGITAFAGLDLRGAKFNGTTLYEADLHGANLGSASLIGANLSYASLQGASLAGAQLGVAPGSGGTAARLTAAYMVGADLTDADLRSVDLSLAHVYGGVKFVRTRLDSARLVNALLAEGDFTQASLNATAFNNALLVNAKFGGAALVNTTFDTAYLQGADFSAVAALQGVTFTSAAVSTASGSWSLKEQDGTPFTYAYGATALGAIATSSSGVTCPNGQTGPCTTTASLTPLSGGPFPPVPQCVPEKPRYDNCLPPTP